MDDATETTLMARQFLAAAILDCQDEKARRRVLNRLSAEAALIEDVFAFAHQRRHQAVAEVSKRCDSSADLLAHPESIVIPQRVSPMEGAWGPRRMNEQIVEVLLDILDHLGEILTPLVPELADASRVPANRGFVPGTQGCGDVVAEELDDFGFVVICNGHG